jgi:hypothetical protein
MTPVPHPAVMALAHKAREQHKDVAAVLAYGSALRDATPETTLVDLYVLTEKFAGVSTSWLAQWGCRLASPNVRYLETEVEGHTYRAKYAVLPLSQFKAKCGVGTANPYFWARFSQPAQVLWTKNEAASLGVTLALSSAAATAFAHAKALSPDNTPIEQWSRLYAETYRTEFRPEGTERAQKIVEQDLAHYTAISLRHSNIAPLRPSWALLRWHGKALTLLRLAKASFTFQGGPDYLAWKIKRHSGVDIQLSDFQRKHPLIASITLLPKLLRKGAVK